MATASEDAVAADLNVQVWKMRRIIKNLDAARGSGTSMISLFVPAKGDIARMSKMLVEEQGTAVNIKNPVNRRSVINAIASAQQRLKLYHRTPPNGLVIYCGTITTDDGKEKRISMDFEPFKPVSAALYFCGSKFQTAPLAGMLSDDSKWGFIIIDGNGSLFATLQGNTREVLQKFSVDLPKKHGRGGQSAPRFARHRVEARHNYLRKVAETAVQMFITDDKPNVSGLILAGSADFKTELGHSDLFDGRLRAIVLKIVDIAYGGQNGFNQAIELAEESLGDVKFVQEKKLIDRYFDEIAQDTGKYCYGVADTMKALEMGAVETLIVWEDLDTVRHVLKNSLTNENTVLHLKPDQQKDKTLFTDKTTGTDLEPIEATPLLEWLAQSYKNYGTTLEIVTNKSQVGMQFCRGFGGIGAMLRYRVELQDSETYEEDAEEFDLDDY